MKRSTNLAIGLLAAAAVYWVFMPVTCTFKEFEQPLTIETVTSGMFAEYIPQTGVVVRDTISNRPFLKVSIDELYLPKIKMGLKASAKIQDTAYPTSLTFIHPEVVNGRFTVDMAFSSEPPAVDAGERIRLQLELSEPIRATLLPLGSFYAETDGTWVYVVSEDGTHATKRNVKLGRKNVDHFEVLEGLKAGDRVITSSYEDFKDQESIELDAAKRQL